MSVMNTLDKDRLSSLIKTLELAKKIGFSSLSSPIEMLLEIQVDLALLLSGLYKAGTQGRLDNKSIRFSEFERDELGNPLQISFRNPRKVYWDPDLADYYRKLARFVVETKNGVSFRKAYMAFDKVTQTCTPKGASKTNKKQCRTSSLQKRKNSAYFRRKNRKT